MIKHINKELLIKEVNYLVFSGLFIIFLFFLCFQYYELNNLHKENMYMTQQIIGTLSEQYPEKEQKIIDSVFNVNDIKAMENGKKILQKYGYDSDISMNEDIRFKKIFTSTIQNSILTITAVIIFVIIVIIFLSKYYISRIQKISLAIDSVIDGNYKSEKVNVCEGIFSRINLKLKQLDRIMNLNFEKVNLEKEKIKSLVTDISHQLKTPLSSIKLYNTLILEENLTKEEYLDFVHRSEMEINKLQDLVDSLMKISRMETGLINLSIERNNLKDTIISAVNGIYLKSSEKNIKIIIHDIEPCYIFHDVKWTKEAIFNVLENAVKYTDYGGKIEIRCVDLVTQIKIDIEDNGIGINREEFNNIFKRFYRVNSEKVKYTEGTGVGLYLTRKILEEQSGCITVDSVEGKGTKFSLFLQKCYEG